MKRALSGIPEGMAVSGGRAVAQAQTQTQLRRLEDKLDAASERNRGIALDLIHEIGATDSVAIMMRRLCEDAAHHDEDERVLLDGPGMADLLLDAKDLLSTEVPESPESFAVADASVAQGATVASSSASAESDVLQPAGGEEVSVFYPTMETGTSCVITLQTKVTAPGGKKSQIDTFLANLSNAYKGAMRDENSEAKLRISLIAEQGKGPQVQALEFRSERDYWGLVAAISRALVRKEEGVHWTGVCEIPTAASSADPSTASTAKKSLLGLLGVSKSRAQETDPDRIEVTGTRLRITSQGGGHVAYALELSSLRALALTSDWVEPKPYLLEIRLASEAEAAKGGMAGVNKHLGGTRLALMGTDLEPVLSPQYYHRSPAAGSTIGAGVNENILLPLSLKEVLECKSSNGLTSIAVLTGTKYNTVEATPSGIHTIPFGSFMVSSGASPRRASTLSFFAEGVGVGAGAGGSGGRGPPQSPPPPLRLNDPLVASVAITQEAPRRAVRIHIVGSTDIPSSRMGAPSAYCAVYLVDDKNQRISDAEAKTEVVKGNNPTWDKDIVLDGVVGLDNVSGVMITVKDSGGGLLKPLHLGQVVVPIGCFIEGHEARLCLPLEPTARMPQHILTLGEIHLTTQLVTLGGPGSYSGASTPAASPSNRGSVVSRSPEAATTSGRKRTTSSSAGLHSNSVVVSYTLRPAAAMGVWWPFRILGGGVQASGHLACRQSFLHLSLSPGHGGPLLNCLEARPAGHRQHPGMFVTIGWDKVLCAVALTESALMVTVSISRAVAAATVKGRPGSVSFDLELLVAPCPSRGLQEALLDRHELHAVRSELTQLVATVAKGTKQTVSAPAGRARQASIVGMGIGTATTTTTVGLAADAVLPVARIILDDLEKAALEALAEMSLCDTTAAAGPGEYGASGSPTVIVSLAPCAVSIALRKQRAIRKQARARLYQAQLIHTCRHLRNAPPFTVAGVQALVALDCTPVLEDAPIPAAALAAALAERQARLEDQAIGKITDYILCSADYWYPAGTPAPSMVSFSLAGAPPPGEGPSVDLSSPAVACLTEIVRGYHDTMRQLLAPYLSSAEAFKRTPGQEAKIAILQLIIQHNLEFDCRVRDKLRLLGLECTPPLTLLARYSLSDLVGWYSSSLVTETQTWLSKTLQNATLFRLNTANLPWDYEEVSGRLISALPETLQQQMNVYLHLVDKDVDTSRAGADPSATAVLLHVRERIIEAVGKCMLLLSDEYRRALQSKHWEQASRPGDDTEKNFSFLMAVCNDCLRVCSFQAAAQELGGGLPEAQGVVVAAFNGTAEIAVKHLVRVTFYDAQVLLADFTDYWAVPAEQATKTLLQTMSSFFLLMRPRLDERFVDRVVSACAEVCVLRFLLLLKDRAGRGKRFSVDEVRRYGGDVAAVKIFFEKAVMPWGQALSSSSGQAPPPTPALLVKQLSCLQDTAEMLVQPLGPPLKALMRVVAKETAPSKAGGLLVLACVIQLRPDGSGSAELEQAARSAVDEASKVPASWHPSQEEEVSLVQRVFGQPETRGQDSGGGALKQLREKASNALKFRKRKMEEEDLRVLQILGLDVNFTTSGSEEEWLSPQQEDDDRSSVAGSALGSVVMHIDEADLIMVTVSRIEVRGLHTASFFGSANPYVAVTLGGQRLKTSVAWNSSSGVAKWKTTTLTFRFARSRLPYARLQVQVFDKERVRRKRALGGVSVKLAGLDLFRIESFFALEGGEAAAAVGVGRSGEVFLSIDVGNREGV